MSWTVFEAGLHWPFVEVMPDDDAIVHEFGDECVCGPDVQYQDPDTGESYEVPMYSHHSLDGRERDE